MGSGRGKDIAAVKSRRDRRLDHPVLVGDLVRSIEAVAIQHRAEYAIIWHNEVLSLFRFGDDRFAGGPYARIDHYQKDGARRIVGSHAGQKARGFFDGVRSNLVSNVRKANVGSDAVNHGAA